MFLSFRKKIYCFCFIVFALNSLSFAQIYSSQQLIPAGHWVYDSMQLLHNACKMASFATNAPISVAELKMYLEAIPYDELSPASKKVYQSVFDFLTEKKKSWDIGGLKFAFNVDLYPEFLYKSNSDIDWTFSTDYTGHYNSVMDYGLDCGLDYKAKDFTFEKLSEARALNQNEYNIFFKNQINNLISHPSQGDNEALFRALGIDYTDDYDGSVDYYSSSSFNTINGLGKGFLTIPIYLGWGDNIFIETNPVISKSIASMSGNYNWSNIPMSDSDFDFLWPRNSYISTGKCFGGWGVNVNFAQQGLQIGKTQTGSIVYNSTFETEGYFQLNLYSNKVKYNLDVVQVNSGRYLYIHSIEARPYFDWIKLGVVEGTFIEQPFELRFLNPLMIMHSFGAWNDYSNFAEEKLYGESHAAAYMGWQIEVNPINNFRIYFLYAQNEIQSDSEKSSANGNAIPDSLGAQLGFELTLPEAKKGGWWTGTIEGVYTSPYLYIKQGADWSLYSKRYNMQSDSDIPICSWIGSPFGPDAVGIQARLGYNLPKKWSAEFDYLFLAHGTNSFGLFDNTIEIAGQTFYAYYPSVLYRMGLLNADQAANIARDYALTGTVSYTNQITLKGSYNINSHFSICGQGTYCFIFNNKNVAGDFEHGFEIALALEYLMF
ncbi:MAG: hypothetical protein K6F15_08925 [Treponema sp.]|nr:hypothetical protein [Treponema sp.]